MKRTLIVIPTYNAQKTILEVVKTIKDLSFDSICICDDYSTDDTVSLLKNRHDLHLIVHDKNIGYGGNQKSLYNYAVENNFDYVIMVHGDGQYNPVLAKAMEEMLKTELYDIVLASRIIPGNAVKNGMPVYKYFFNRSLTLFQNIFLGAKLSEYHTGYRGYSIHALKTIPFNNFSNNFVFDNQFLVSGIKQKLKVGEISCPTIYNKDSSSINFKNSIKYGVGCLYTTFKIS